MATVVDALIVTLGLDPTDFNANQKKAAEDLVKFKGQAATTAKEVEASGKKAAEFFGQMKTAAIGFFTLLAGQSMAQFAQQVVTSEANVGRLAKNLGIATEDLSVWEGVVQRMGGTSQDADAALAGLAQTLFDIRSRGDVSKIPIMNALGLTVDDLKNPTEALLKLSEAAQRLPQAEFYQKAKLLGIPDSVITTLAQGRQKVEDLIDSQRRLNVVTDDDAEAGARFQKSLSEIHQAADSLGRDFVNGVNPAVHDFADTMTGLAKDQGVKDFMKTSGDWAGKFGSMLFGGLGTQAKVAGDLLHGDLGGALRDWNAQSDRVHNMIFGAPQSAPAPTSTGIPHLASSNMEAQLLSAGIPPHVVRGVMAGISAESNMDPNASNPTSGAYGYGQWLGSRKAELFRRFGPNPTPDQQIQYLIWELKGGDAGGNSVLSAKTERDALNAYVNQFMRPGTRPLPGGGTEASRDLDRGNRWLAGNQDLYAMASQPSQTLPNNFNFGSITINTRATDAQGIAADLVPTLRSTIASQAGRGM